MNSYERVMKIVRGETPDRLPVWASRHNKDGFLADTAEGMLKREIEFQEEFDWDMARISPAAALQVMDFGCRFSGNNHLGVPSVVERPVSCVGDWEKIGRLDPEAGRYGSIAGAIKGLGEYLKGSKLNMATAFSPLTLAQKCAGDDVLLDTMRNHAEILKTALDVFADTMIDFINHCADNGADSLYFATQTATKNLITGEEAALYEKCYSLKVLSAVRPRMQAIFLHLHGDNIMIDHFEEYPIDVLNWADRRTVPPVPISEGIKYFSRGIMGGVNGRTTLCTGPEEDIREEIADAYRQAGKPIIISPCCVIPVSGLPDKNIHVMRNAINTIAL